MKPSIILLFVLSLLFSCQPKEETTQEIIPVQEQTPEFEQPNKEFSFKRSGYENNMIKQLYEEALSNNKELRDLDDAINDLNERNSDSLMINREYFSRNTRFWRSAMDYTNQIQDSTLRVDTKDLLKESENTYELLLADYTKKSTDLSDLSKKLRDEKKLLELLVALNMMRNYQKDELPDSNPLEHLIKDYKEILKEVTLEVDELKN